MPFKRATLFGILLAFLGPLAVGKVTSGFSGFGEQVLGQLGLWLVGGLLMWVILAWEKKPLSSVGLKLPSLQSVLWGLLTAVAMLYLVSPVAAFLVSRLDAGAFSDGLGKLQGLPAAYMVVAGVTAGVVEELLYRGFLVERLALLTRNRWSAGALAIAVFTLVHIPFWGLVGALFTGFGGALLTLLFLWRRDLWANMVAHSVTAVVQLLPLAAGAI
ncbi:MAG: CPBP family intramembrane metalloprotease [Deltaproteobacteria bacterium]|nr:CPBP family intramembrane metalloprotease [Deltaproteobacteria bacterium]